MRYGVNFNDLENDDQAVLYWNLGRMTPEEFRGSVILVACHAAGWAGLVASRIAPTLQTKYYIGFCLFLILNGLLHAYYVIKGKSDLRFAGILPLRALLREFPKLDKGDSLPQEPTDQ